MDFSYFKYMSYINKHEKVSWVELSNHFKISKAEAREIVTALNKQGYISYRGDTEFVSTIKGKNFISSFIFSFINKNFVSILALIVSIISLIFSGIALFNS